MVVPAANPISIAHHMASPVVPYPQKSILPSKMCICASLAFDGIGAVVTCHHGIANAVPGIPYTPLVLSITRWH